MIYSAYTRRRVLMSYGEIITRALGITWRHRYLWLLALFAGEGVASFSSISFSQPSSDGGASNYTPAQIWSMVTTWVAAHVPLLVVCGVGILTLALVLLLLSAIADGALVRASSEHDRERPFSLGTAWSSGLATFWPVLKVKLLAVLAGVVSFIVIGGMAVLAVVSAQGGATSTTVLLVIVAALLGLAGLPIFVAFSVVILLMVREVVLGGQTSTWAALSTTVSLLRRRLGRVALLWLLSVALGMASGIAFGLVITILLGIIAGLAVIVYLAGGISAAIVAGIVLGVPWLLVLLIASGAIAAYTSTFWTLGYTRLGLEPEPQVALVPPAAA
jgi:hypothetical protein